MTGLNPLPSLIRASAHDAGSMNMRANGRKKWNDDDWNAMCETQDRLIRNIYGKPQDHNEPNWCFIRFQIAEQMEKRGEFGLKSGLKEILRHIDELTE